MIKKKVAIFGTYPPPIGGTSIYIQRLYNLIKEDYDAQVFDTYGNSDSEDNAVFTVGNYKQFIVKYLFTCKHDIIHVHSHSWKDRFALVVVSRIRKKKILITYHNFRQKYNELSKMEKVLSRFTLRFSTLHLAVNEDMKQILIDWGAPPSKVKIVPTFLLPNKKQNYEVNHNIEEFSKKFEYVICANGSNTDKYNGEDLYGIDLCIELTDRLRDTYNVGFVFVLTKISDRPYYNSLVEKIKERNLEDRFLLFVNNSSLLPILKSADLFVRPTNTDSFGISIGEALSLEKPSIASDVCKRIDGTILFKNRNIDDFHEKVCTVLDNFDFYVNKTKNIDIRDNSEDILNVYRNL